MEQDRESLEEEARYYAATLDQRDLIELLNEHPAMQTPPTATDAEVQAFIAAATQKSLDRMRERLDNLTCYACGDQIRKDGKSVKGKSWYVDAAHNNFCSKSCRDAKGVAPQVTAGAHIADLEAKLLRAEEARDRAEKELEQWKELARRHAPAAHKLAFIHGIKEVLNA